MKIEKLKLCEFLYLATTRCNCRCIHCSPHLHEGSHNEISSQKMIACYERSELLQRNAVSVAGGEPFIKEDIEEFILYLDEKQIRYVVSSNGWFTDRIESCVRKMKHPEAARFAISIDGPAEVHDSIRNLPGVFQRAQETAKMLAGYHAQVQINMVAQKKNYSCISDLKEKFKKIGIPLIVIPRFRNDEEEQLDTSLEEIRAVFPYLTEQKDRKVLLSRGEFVIPKGTCHAGRNSWLLDSNGDVYACCGGFCRHDSDRYLIGNLCEEELDALLSSEKADKVYLESVMNCSGCSNARDVERETTVFGLSTEITAQEAGLRCDTMGSVCRMEEEYCDNGNWHELEHDSHEYGAYRWMRGNEASVFLKAPKVVSRLEVSLFNLREKTASGEDVWIGLYLDDRIIMRTKCSLGERTIAADIQSLGLSGGIHKITICTNICWSPKTDNLGTDGRTLGLAARQICMF